MGFSLSLGGGGLFGDMANVLSGGAWDKMNIDRQQAADREAAEKSRDISVEMFNLNKQENLEAFKRNQEAELAMWERNKGLADVNWEREKSYNNEMWEREKAYNLDLWNKQNAYNTPAAQMERFKQAGINPLMVASQGTPGNAVAIRGSDINTSELETPSVEAAAYDPARADSAKMSGGVSVSHAPDLMKGLLDYMGIRNADMDLKNKAAGLALRNEEVRAAKRENDYLEKTGSSKFDPLLLRLGSRIADFWSRVDPRGSDWWKRWYDSGGHRDDPPIIPPFLIKSQGGN